MAIEVPWISLEEYKFRSFNFQKLQIGPCINTTPNGPFVLLINPKITQVQIQDNNLIHTQA